MFKRNTLSVFFIMLGLLFSAVAAQAQTAEPQQGAINTTRSNIKNTSRTGVGRFDPIMIDLTNASGKVIASVKLTDTDGDGKLSESEGKFDFGVLPEGEYVLSISSIVVEDKSADASKVQASALPKITIILDGTKEGSIKKELTLAESDARKLDTKIDTVNGDLSAKKPAGVKYKDIILKADGKNKVTGKASHDMTKNVIQNMR